MKAQLLMLSAAGLLLAAPAAFATPDREVQAFVDHAQSAAQARLLAAGVGEPAAITKVRGVIGADGRLSGVHVVGASGSRETDFAVERALRRLDVGEPPTALIGAQLTLDLGPASPAPASAR